MTKRKFKVYAMETQANDGTYEVSIWSDGGQTTSFYGTKEQLLRMAKEIPNSIKEWEETSIKPDKETTQFTCGSCGEKWNLVSPKSDTDTCPECGVTVYSDSFRSSDTPKQTVKPK